MSQATVVLLTTSVQTCRVCQKTSVISMGQVSSFGNCRTDSFGCSWSPPYQHVSHLQEKIQIHFNVSKHRFFTTCGREEASDIAAFSGYRRGGELLCTSLGYLTNQPKSCFEVTVSSYLKGWNVSSLLEDDVIFSLSVVDCSTM